MNFDLFLSEFEGIGIYLYFYKTVSVVIKLHIILYYWIYLLFSFV